MIDKKAPDFEFNAYIDGHFRKIKLDDYKGKWVILVFYPGDFTDVCPTELEAFAEEHEDFSKIDAVIIAASTDSLYSHRAWFTSSPKLKTVKYPVIADRKGELAAKYGVFDEETGNARRGLFIIDPTGTIKYIAITDDLIGRSTIETYRILTALQTGEECAANWTPGSPTIERQ